MILMFYHSLNARTFDTSSVRCCTSVCQRALVEGYCRWIFSLWNYYIIGTLFQWAISRSFQPTAEGGVTSGWSLKSFRSRLLSYFILSFVNRDVMMRYLCLLQSGCWRNDIIINGLQVRNSKSTSVCYWF